VAAVSPYFTELEAARYCRCGVTRLRSWVERGFLAVRADVDGRRFYLRDELDLAMGGKVANERVPPLEPVAVPSTRAAPSPATKASAELPYTEARKPGLRGAGR
jgi:hypothetical protein